MTLEKAISQSIEQRVDDALEKASSQSIDQRVDDALEGKLAREGKGG